MPNTHVHNPTSLAQVEKREGLVVLELVHDILGLAIEREHTALLKAALDLDIQAALSPMEVMRNEAASTYQLLLNRGNPRSEIEQDQFAYIYEQMVRLDTLLLRCKEISQHSQITYEVLVSTSFSELMEVVAEHSDS